MSNLIFRYRHTLLTTKLFSLLELYMKKQRILLLVGLLVALLLLSACGGSGNTNEDNGNGSQEALSANGESQVANQNEPVQIVEEKARLADNYANALSIQGQLALGTLRLEDGDLAINEETAAELLPLWQALQSLMNSDTTAAVELEAVVNQIQDGMSAAQIAAISEMKLTEESLTSMMENGELAFGRGAGRDGDGEGGFFGALPEGFTPPEGGVVIVGPGGGPGGGLGGGQGGGFGGGPGGGIGGGPGGGFGNLDEDARATRLAEFANGGTADFQETLLVGLVVRLLQQKSGELPETFGRFDAVFDLITEETGLSMEEIQAQAADGATLAEIIEANGGDLAAVRTSLFEALGELPNAADLDLEQMADEWLGLSAD